MEKSSLFHSQHPLVKLLLVLVLINLSLMSNWLQQALLAVITITYLFISPGLLLDWLKLSLRLLPLLIVITMFGLFSKTDFYDVLLLNFRLIYMLMISVYLFKSSSISHYRGLMPANKSFHTWLQATMLFIPLFFESYKEAKKDSNNLLTIIDKSLNMTHSQLENVRRKTSCMCNVNGSFSWKADIPAIFCMLISIAVFYFTEV